MDIIAELRSRFYPATGRAQVQARATSLESLAIDPVAALDEEMSRSGRRFNGVGVAAGAAPIQAIPTTTATHAIYNPDTKRAYVLDQIGCYLLSGTATSGLTIFGIVSAITATLPTAATGSLIASSSCTSGAASKAIFATAYTLPAQASGQQWFVVGASNSGVPSVGGGATFDVKGRIIVPPGRVLGLAILAGAGTSPLYVPHATWHEVETDLE